MAYRRRMIDSPSYTLNHEEITKAFEEGIRFAEMLVPEEVQVDDFGAAKALVFHRHAWDAEKKTPIASGEVVTLPARTILVAAGTQPNTVLAREDEHNVQVDGRYFQAIDEEGQPAKPERIAKPKEVRVLMSMRPDGRSMSFFGDLHPSFAGNVVKAMGGAKQGYPVVSRALAKVEPTGPSPEELVAKLNDELRTVVHEVIRLTPNIVEVVVRAPIAARAFKPGQFYRLQNFESPGPNRTDGTVLAMEALALTGASVDHERGLLSTIVLEMGGSSDLCALLKPGEPISLMGPTGTPTETPAKRDGPARRRRPGQRGAVLDRPEAPGGGLAGDLLRRLQEDDRPLQGRRDREGGRRHRLVLGRGPRVHPRPGPGSGLRGQHRRGDGRLCPGGPRRRRDPARQADRLVVIGSDGMMRGVQQARHGILRPFLKPEHHAIGSINSPMQCMMKEICAQCLQTHRDPVTGQETVVFSCFNQDQPLDHVRFDGLRGRLSQNNVQEKLTKLWIDECLSRSGLRSRAAALV